MSVIFIPPIRPFMKVRHHFNPLIFGLFSTFKKALHWCGLGRFFKLEPPLKPQSLKRYVFFINAISKSPVFCLWRPLIFFWILAPGGIPVVQGADLPIPRFVSLRSEKINARVGPGLRYPMEWIFVRHKLPVKVLREFGHWRLIQDIEGAEGWVHQRMLSGLRTVMVQNNEYSPLYKEPSVNAPVVAHLEPGVICDLLAVEKLWVRVKVDAYKGWIERHQIWGVLETESSKGSF